MINRRIKNTMLAIEYIEAHLTEPIDLDSIANAVHYSKHYLHRTFTSTVGLTLHDYVQRRKLTEAAKLLVFSGKPILEIALLAGYESQQAFTSVFTAMYKQPPSKFRENEEFYPLQSKFEFEGAYAMLNQDEPTQWGIRYATQDDIPGWMALVQDVIGGFPHLHEEEYQQVLCERIATKQALVLKDNATVIGAMLFTKRTGNIDFLGIHPLYRNKGIPKAFLDRMMSELIDEQQISITTYREGDKADTGQRKWIRELGFAEADLLVEFGYPTQRFVLPKESIIEHGTTGEGK